MGNAYAYLEDAFLDDPDYETPAEKLVAVHLFTRTDAAGVSPWKIGTAVERTAVSEKTVRRTIERLEERGKLVRSNDARAIWLKAGIFYRLHKGHYSQAQMKGTVTRLLFWGARGSFDGHQTDIFGTDHGHSSDTPGTNLGSATGNFPSRVAQLYAVKYGINIPLPSETVPFLTILKEEVSPQRIIKDVDKLSTAGKRLFIRLALAPTYRTAVNEIKDVAWIDDLFQEFGFDRVMRGLTVFLGNGKKPSGDLADQLRQKVIEARD